MKHSVFFIPRIHPCEVGADWFLSQRYIYYHAFNLHVIFCPLSCIIPLNEIFPGQVVGSASYAGKPHLPAHLRHLASLEN